MIKPKTPLLTVDCVIKKNSRFLLIKRKYEPFKNMFALPGGFVEEGESVEEACVREIQEETNLCLNMQELRLLNVYSKPGRDPRGPTASVVFFAYYPGDQLFKAGDDANHAELVKYTSELQLAFDHNEIINEVILKFN